MAPSPWEQGQPVLPPQHRPLLPGWPGAGLGEERGALAEPSLGRSRLARGSQPGARSGQQELSRFLRPRAEKARPRQVPKLRPAARPGIGSEGGGSRTGLGPAAARGHWSCLGSRSPPVSPLRNSGHCSHYHFFLFLAFVHTRYKTSCPSRLLPAPPGPTGTPEFPGSGGFQVLLPQETDPHFYQHPWSWLGASLRPPGWLEGQTSGMDPSIHPRDGKRAPATALGGSWSAESPQETQAAGAAHSPGPPLSSRAKLFLTGNLPSVKTKRE